MTDREVFEKVKDHLLRQMKKSTGPMGCLYRGPGGLKCAIGCLIPDERYHRGLERFTASCGEVLAAAGLDESQASLAQKLQEIHDDVDPYLWARELEALSREVT